MTENQDMETLTAKASEPDAPSAAPKKSRRWVKPLIWALSIVLALCVGTVVGGGVVYGVMRVRDRISLGAGIPSIRSYRFGPGDSTVDMPTFGALIVEVTDDSPAERAGLTQGSVILALDGRELDAERGLAERIAEFKPGDTVTLQVWEPAGRRTQRTSEVKVTLGEHPEREGAAYLGVTFMPFPGGGPQMDWGRPFGEFHFDCEGSDCDKLPFDEHVLPFFQEGALQGGAIVQRVVADSPASDAGLQVGDVITAIDGEPVEDPEALSQTIKGMKPGDAIVLGVYRSESEREIEVTLGEHPEDKNVAYLGLEIGGFFRMERHFEREEAPRSFRFFGLPGRQGPGTGQWFEFRGMPHNENLDGSDLFVDSI
jgi:membrane-associated protease RseP (regulator of RpoE activity)